MSTPSLASLILATCAGAVLGQACDRSPRCKADTTADLSSLLQARIREADRALQPSAPPVSQQGWCCYVDKSEKGCPKNDTEASNGCNPYGHWCGQSEQQCLSGCSGTYFCPGPENNTTMSGGVEWQLVTVPGWSNT